MYWVYTHNFDNDPDTIGDFVFLSDAVRAAGNAISIFSDKEYLACAHVVDPNGATLWVAGPKGTTCIPDDKEVK